MSERAIIAAVAYPDLRDHSAPFVVLDRLAARPVPDGVVIEDLSFNPIAVVQRLEDERADPPGRIVFVAAVPRGRGRPPGTVTAYRWDGELPSAAAIQDAVAAGVTGIIHLDNTLVVARHFGALPAVVDVIEIEPRDHAFGHTLSRVVAAAIAPAAELALRIATDDAFAATLPRSSAGGFRPAVGTAS